MELEQLFSAKPPLEALKLLCSLMVSLKTSRSGKPLKLGPFRHFTGALYAKGTP